MSADLLALLPGRRGHFRMESGYHSESWYNLDSLFDDRTRLQPFAAELAHQLAPFSPEIVCGPQTGGAQLAAMIAVEIGCAALGTERHEPAGASGLFSVQYRVPQQQRSGLRARRVAIVDDAISAGSAVKGTYRDLIECGAQPIVCGALIIFGGAAAAFAAEKNLALRSVTQTGFALYPPGACPLCTAGVPLVAVSDVQPPPA